mgnify:CR=1 FL=1
MIDNSIILGRLRPDTALFFISRCYVLLLFFSLYQGNNNNNNDSIDIYPRFIEKLWTAPWRSRSRSSPRLSRRSPKRRLKPSPQPSLPRPRSLPPRPRRPKSLPLRLRSPLRSRLSRRLSLSLLVWGFFLWLLAFNVWMGGGGVLAHNLLNIINIIENYPIELTYCKENAISNFNFQMWPSY